MNSQQRRKEARAKARQAGKFFFILIVVVLIILTLGVFIHLNSKGKELSTLEKKKQRLQSIDQELKILKPKKEKIEKEERWFFIVVRFFIGIIILKANYMYHHFIGKVELDEIIGVLVDFNSGILLCYSFGAYLLYGSLDKFVANMKAKIIKEFRKYHIDDFGRIELLNAERERLIKEIFDEENPKK